MSIFLGFLAFRLLIAFLNYLFRARLPRVKDNASLPTLSVLIPARNEASNIGLILHDLIRIEGEEIREIIVYDDASDDATPDIVSEYMLQDERIRLLRSQGLPDGWLGKNNACHRLAQEARGDYFLFLDADVRVAPDFINRLLAYAVGKKVSLLSIFPCQTMYSWAEKITVPNMHVILLSLLLLPMVRRVGFSSVAAANGQCMLFESRVYRALLPHLRFRASRAEDIEIARYLKKQKEKVACLTGVATIRCRMYDSLDSAIEGFSKNVTFFFGNSYVGAIFYWLLTTLGWVFVGISSFELLLLYLSMGLLMRLFISLTALQNVFNNIILAIPQQLMLGAFIVKSLKNKHRGYFSWKGRKL
ncbi:glycosyltransferase [Porphyromonas circumdentaria]|uniref:glycosyltransferase n=1 Tax=Porphyromonas circumdentaria TaxID=29524 RepID=UPI0026DB234B|nr:glycosyltransferase family 2 protein [Porphyromonas circumdentaria]